MTPKGLLRLKQAGSVLADFSEGKFEPVLDDPRAQHESVRRLVLCSGKLFYDIDGHEDRAAASAVAVARLEQLYPFPVEQAAALTARYPQLQELVWAQEEPQNMGAWRTLRHRLEAAAPDGVPVRYVGRPWRASPSEGYPTAHRLEQDRIVREALGTAPGGCLAKLAAGENRGAELGSVCPRRLQHLPALRLRQPTPEVERGERDPQRACRAKAWHRAIFAYRSEPGLLALAVSISPWPFPWSPWSSRRCWSRRRARRLDPHGGPVG